jgi:hypothetical protein
MLIAEENNRFVYALHCPWTGEVRYVGKTARGSKRPPQHLVLSSWFKKSTHKEKWIAKCVNAGRKPEWSILAYCCDDESLDYKEIELIALYRSIGFNLTNSTEGGEGGIPTEATRKKMSKAHKGKKHSLETRKKMSKAHRGKKLSEAHAATLRAANTGKKHSLETRKKMSKVHKGRKHSEESIEKMSKAKRGKKHTEKSRRNMSKAKMGKKLSEAHKSSLKASRISTRDARRNAEHYVPRANPHNITLDLANKIREEYVPRKNGAAALAKKYGLTRMIVRGILTRKTWDR